MAKIKNNTVLRKEIRESALGELSADSISITDATLSAVPVTISGTYDQAEVQAVADAVRELSKIVLGE